MFEFVDGVNEKLGYRLFRDIYSYRLKRDFEKVAKAVETYKKEGKIEVEKLVRDTEFKEVGDFITAISKY